MPEDRPHPPDEAHPPRAVVLLSGGLDSSVAAAIACADGFEVHALSVRYGQRHAVELDAARRVAASLGLASHRIVDLDLRSIGGSALTDAIPVPRTPSSRAAQSVSAGSLIPVTYVPARNTILLGLALAHAEVLDARDIYVGVSSVDYSGYPDCRPEFVEAFERLAQLATKAGTQGGRFRIHAPLQHLTKAQTVQRGLELGVDFSLTHSCYDPRSDGSACGSCDACRLRRAGFDAAGVQDPTRYATEQPGARTDLAGSCDASPHARPHGSAPHAGASLRVLEVYRTIQGETSLAGLPCIIVRLAGCPLRCSYCDTAYARQAEGLELGVEELVRSVTDAGPGLVVVTGGEPLAQPAALEALRALADAGRTVLLETSGAFDASAVDPRVRRIIDVKTPGSGMVERNLAANLAELRPGDELKFVLVDRADYEWSRDLVRHRRLDQRCTILFSPVAERLPPADLARWIIDDGLPVRLQLQLHRILWPDADRGV